MTTTAETVTANDQDSIRIKLEPGSSALSMLGPSRPNSRHLDMMHRTAASADGTSPSMALCHTANCRLSSLSTSRLRSCPTASAVWTFNASDTTREVGGQHPAFRAGDASPSGSEPGGSHYRRENPGIAPA